MTEYLNLIRDFMDSGGNVLYPIMLVTFILWTVILERLWYFWRDHPRRAQALADSWNERSDHESWYARQIRSARLSELSAGLHDRLNLVKALVGICPLLGLLGTVTGMIEVFEVMADHRKRKPPCDGRRRFQGDDSDHGGHWSRRSRGYT